MPFDADTPVWFLRLREYPDIPCRHGEAYPREISRFFGMDFIRSASSSINWSLLASWQFPPGAGLVCIPSTRDIHSSENCNNCWTRRSLFIRKKSASDFLKTGAYHGVLESRYEKHFKNATAGTCRLRAGSPFQKRYTRGLGRWRGCIPLYGQSIRLD